MAKTTKCKQTSAPTESGGAPGLSPKQEAFCLAYLKLGNASEAYRRSYDAGGMKPATVNRTAKELLDNPKIAARLAELRAPAVEKAKLTLQQHLEDLQQLRNEARGEAQFGAAVSAEVARGKAAGLYIEKVELGFADMTDEQLEAKFRKLTAPKDSQEPAP